MTKEEIIDALDWRTNDEGTPFTYSNLETAMDLYAKEVAIDFKNWTDANARLEDYREQRALTDDELFSLYQQEKSSLK